MNEDKPTFSIISVYNDKDLLSQWLEESLNSQQGVDYETVFINNTDDHYQSAPEALNEGAKRASGEYYVFSHQDVRFLSSESLKNIRNYLSSLDNLGVAGVTGITNDGHGINRIYHGLPQDEVKKELLDGYPRPWNSKPLSEFDLTEPEWDEIANAPEAAHPWGEGRIIHAPHRVQTVDEVFLVAPSQTFDNNPFNAILCDGWHLYGVEYALRMRYKKGKGVYVLPTPIWHRSTGDKPGDDFFRLLVDLATEYRGYKFKSINATTGIWPIEDYARRPLSEQVKRGIKNPIGAIKYVREHYF